MHAIVCSHYMGLQLSDCVHGHNFMYLASMGSPSMCVHDRLESCRYYTNINVAFASMKKVVQKAFEQY